MSESKVILEDIRALRFCNSGARTFFERHSLDWNDFRINGIDFASLEATADGMATAAVRQAKIRLGLITVSDDQ